ncbi:hypothetical protein OX284_013770 [Flavobacterium sp. SUN046]|nr:hypothetical protein [Flavobacterium sp. SUN046]
MDTLTNPVGMAYFVATDFNPLWLKENRKSKQEAKYFVKRIENKTSM